MDSRRYYFTCHPRYIEKKAQELVSALAGTDYYPYRPQDVAKTVYAVALSRPSHARTVALIARSVAKELFWLNPRWRKDFVDELVDLAASKFFTSWADDIERLSEASDVETRTYENPETSSDEDDLLFKASNPRLDEFTYSALYEEDCGHSDVERVPPMMGRSTPRIIVSCASPTPSMTYEAKEPSLCINDTEDANTPLVAATVIFGDLFAMGLVPVQTMESSTLYLAENLLSANDSYLLHTVLTRVASHVAPQLGVPFLQQCHAYVVMNQNILEENGYQDVHSILKVINELITCESTSSTGTNTALYSHLACHRWDPSLPKDISWGL